MSTPQALVEALLMKSILGEELTDTKFHLFSDRSVHTSKVTRIQALSANNAILAFRSEFFAELLSTTESSDATFVDFDCGSSFEDDMALDDYGYGSDSDLEDEEEQLGQTQAISNEIVQVPEGDDNDLLVVTDAMSKIDSTVSISTPQRATPTSVSSQHRTLAVGCRSILVRNTAFRTLKALIRYLYTDKIVFSSLKSQRKPRVNVEGPNPVILWPCSPKSMYRLACKVRLDGVRNQAFSAIQSGLNKENILEELSSSFTSKYPEILQMQVDILLEHIASIPVIQNIPALIKRIAGSQLPHGADIMIDLYQKILLLHHPEALAFANAPPPQVMSDCPKCRDTAPVGSSPRPPTIIFPCSPIAISPPSPIAITPVHSLGTMVEERLRPTGRGGGRGRR